jgi:excisionase family DNA binding protein
MSPRPQIKKTFCTTAEAASLLGVSLRTAQLWVENGTLEAWKTEGGHRRILRTSVERLIDGKPSTPQIATALNTVPPGAESTTPRADETVATGPENRPLNILVVEDDLDLCRLYRLTLNHWPMRPRVRISANVVEALVLIGQDPPDLLITDLRMPGVQDGFFLLRALHDMPSLRGMTMVAVSGLSDAEIALEGRLPAGIPVLPKPIPFARLEAIATDIAARLASVNHMALEP